MVSAFPFPHLLFEWIMFYPFHQGGHSLSTVTTSAISGNDVSLLFKNGGQQYVLTADTTTRNGVLASVKYSIIINLMSP